jgi:poly-gamma-glutamate synthesis protein (capsule biosynthesis protein)
MSYASGAGNFSIAVAGDCMLTRSLKSFDEPAFLQIRDKFRECDAGFANLESVVRHWNEGTPGITRGTFMTTPPELLDDLKWFGITMVGCANNHAFDYGEGGVVATLRHLGRAGIAHAGTGCNLAEARMPAYVDTKGGRVALIATTATFRPWNRAGAQRADMRGRPGINPFSSRTTYTVDGEAFNTLKRISRELGFDRTRQRDQTHFFSESEVPTDEPEELSIFDQRFALGRECGARSTGDKADIEDNLRWIREARRQADWVVVSFHCHAFSQRSVATATTRVDLHEPADFVPEFARLAIAEGADIFVGHGSHTPLGIDIYNGKPIFYSLGNLVLQNETVPLFPDEAYSRFGLGHSATPADFLDARTDAGKKGHVANAGFWENIFATCRFDRGKLVEIRIYPIDQGFGQSRAQRGRPVMAVGDMAERIIERVKRLSEPYGVRVKAENGVGIIRPV